MPKFQINDNGHSFVITAPDQASAMSAYGAFKNGGNAGGAAGAPAAPGVAAQPQVPLEQRNPNDPNTFLAMPGTQPPAGTPYNQPQSSQTFGTSQADTLNPLPALSALGNTIASSVPVAGPYLKDAGEKFDAALDNNVYRPLTGTKGTTTPQDVAQTNARDAAANPGVVPLGQAVGAVAPYMVAGEVPLLNQALGMAGPWAQRLAMTGLSQYAINTGNNLAHGQNPVDAGNNAVLPTAAAVPFALLGPEGRAESAYADAVGNLKANGVQLTAGQQKGSNALMQAESQLGGIAAQNFRDKQLSQLTKAALKTAGVSAEAATPDVMDAAYTKIGNQFDNIAAMSTIKADAKLFNDLSDTVAQHYMMTGQNIPVLASTLDRVQNIAAANGGVIPGKSYKAVASDLSAAMKNYPTLAAPLGQMKDALDDAVQRGLSGQTLAAWQKLRQQYANLMTVTDAVTKAGGAAKAGLVTPEALDTAVRGAMTKRQYARGVGDLNQLSRDAVIAMPRLANSGTTARMAPYVLASGAGAALHSADPATAIAGIVGSFAVPAIAGRALLSAPVRSLLADGSHIPQSVARGLTPMIAPTVPLPALPGFQPPT
jgi:hypothetical protein